MTKKHLPFQLHSHRAKEYPLAKAQHIARELTRGELDGWHYIVRVVTGDWAVVIVYDEANMLVGFWNQ